MDFDILIFGGQSNMQGTTESLPDYNPEIENTLEYRYLSDELIPLKHPVGENIGEGLLFWASEGHGSLVPDFCNTYQKLTGKNVLAIHAARGGTEIAEWEKGTERYDASIKKIESGIKKAKTLGNIGHIYYIWLQGESDARRLTPQDVYMQKLTKYKNDIFADAGIEKFCIIEVGYFCGPVSYVNEYTDEEAYAMDEVIMEAQEKLCKNDDDFIILTDVCKDLSRNPEYINPFCEGHYNNKAMTIIGNTAGEALAKL